MRKKILFLSIFCLMFFIASSALAVESVDLLKNTGAAAGYPSQTANEYSMAATVGAIINIALGILGTIFLGLTFYAGYLWFTAGGEEEKVTQAKAYLYNGLIGMVIVLASYGLSRFVVTSIISATFGG
ncbi:MAG: hypothetical protein UU69_C0030G0005 [Candidatus Magasanikbacteria bacterium GW2011_GWA2_41_55]|uniref:Integral membrane protein n=1 Tax=Candidatus Magasanikbacteria bacterium GW2011_GWA2_41_55 TaxID=1619038 RepID=A0A0G0ZHS8_9BACT|nr:MAG: hypothetical protein UU69_C0030G0005 [Candidatus Magasanikbacteria bacterium GW2011_GWA2_41_55]